MIPSHYMNEVELTFDGLTARERAIFNEGFQSGMHRANNDAQPRLGDLEIRIDKATSLVREAINALYSPSF